jgi:outer membrane immunogenic protein
MKKLLLASLAIASLAAGPGNAADLYAKAPRAVAVAPACAQFGGGYIGVQGGSVTHDTGFNDHDSWADQFNVDISLSHVERSRWGGAVGPLVGWNLQRNCTVFGVEVDWSWTSISHSRVYTGNGLPAAMAVTLEDKVRWFGTARTRGGIVVNDVLLYATGGFAFGNVRHAWTLTQPGLTEGFNTSNTRWGWTTGVGSEWAWTDRISIKFEALYVRFVDRETTFFSPSNAQNFTVSHQDALWVTRVGLNYRWGAPVVARY